MLVGWDFREEKKCIYKTRSVKAHYTITWWRTKLNKKD